MSAAKKTLTLRELKKRLKPFGIITMTKRGKGSENILLKPDAPGSFKGPQIPIKNHGEGRTTFSSHVVDAILRRFEIDGDEFWS